MTLTNTAQAVHTPISPADGPPSSPKTGNGIDRLDWLTYQLQKGLTGNEVKLLLAMTRDAAKDGTLFSSYTRLARMATLTRSRFFDARKGLVAKACIRQLPPHNHQLTGYDDGWAIDQTVWRERTGYPQGKSPESGTSNVRNQGLTSPVLGTSNPPSSSCHKKPNEEPNVTGDCDSTGKAVFEHVEPAETALDFDPDEGFGRAVFSEEEGVTGVTIDGCEEHDQEPEQIPSKAENPRITPTPLSPKLTEQDVRDWLDRNVSELPQEFEISNLVNWTWEVWQYPAHPYGWKYGKDTAVRTCSKDTASRRKFREDVVQHLMAKGLPVTGADGQIERDPVRCDRCRKLSRTYSLGLLFKDPFTGFTMVNGCPECIAAAVPA